MRPRSRQLAVPFSVRRQRPSCIGARVPRIGDNARAGLRAPRPARRRRRWLRGRGSAGGLAAARRRQGRAPGAASCTARGWWSAVADIARAVAAARHAGAAPRADAVLALAGDVTPDPRSAGRLAARARRLSDLTSRPRAAAPGGPDPSGHTPERAPLGRKSLGIQKVVFLPRSANTTRRRRRCGVRKHLGYRTLRCCCRTACRSSSIAVAVGGGGAPEAEGRRPRAAATITAGGAPGICRASQ